MALVSMLRILVDTSLLWSKSTKKSIFMMQYLQLNLIKTRINLIKASSFKRVCFDDVEDQSGRKHIDDL
jgi:hypothetical protein